MIEILLLAGLSATAFAFVSTGSDDADTEGDAPEPNDAVDDTHLAIEDPAETDPDARIDGPTEANWTNDDFEVVGPDDLAEADSLHANLVVRNDEGGDTVDVRGAHNAIVYSGEGDSVSGGHDTTDGADFVSVSSGGAQVEGGDGDSTFLSSGDGDSIDAGAGDDLIIGGTGAAQLDGGDGEDTIYASYPDYAAPTATQTYDMYVDDSSDTIDGGAGDDVIYAGSGDIVSGGSGDDSFALFGLDNTVTDFDAAEDQISLQLPAVVDGVSVVEELSSTNLTTSDDGTTVTIYYKGDVMLRIPSQDGISIAYQNDNSWNAEQYNLADGAPIEDASIVIKFFTSSSS
jgi:Ca2+-binding RTX toxin-like protein